MADVPARGSVYNTYYNVGPNGGKEFIIGLLFHVPLIEGPGGEGKQLLSNASAIWDIRQ